MAERCFSREALRNAEVCVHVLEPGCLSPSPNKRAWRPPVNQFHRDKRGLKHASKQTLCCSTREHRSSVPAAGGKPLPCKNLEDLKFLTLKSKIPVFSDQQGRAFGAGRESIVRRRLIRRRT